MMEVTFRRLQTHEDFEACVALQKATWGQQFQECVPPAILMVAQKVGGVTAGAFDPAGRLVGFVFGLTGVKESRLVHWSHMLAVVPELQGEGLGYRLKLFQRELLLDVGVEVIYWTYDPLVARNAHLNLNKLGVQVEEYVPNMYGDDTGSDLHRGIGMDRFVVAWHIADERVKRLLEGKGEEQAQGTDAPVVNTALDENGAAAPIERDLPRAPAVRVEIPSDITVIQQTSLDLAAKWRASTRRAFLYYQEKGYGVDSFYRDRQSGRCFYLLKIH
ncbi:hypothetical protein D6833_14090 [Candidatus Parcubacteria bacterium]|nr:MAG: hypothetical protein D6833_14090 [Candidatus Parcubacteria bacterium]